MSEKKDKLQMHTNVDMSHQNKLWFKIKLFLDSLRVNGIRATLARIAQRLYYKQKGVDFSTQNLHDLTLAGEYTSHGTALVSSSKEFFKRVFLELEEAAGREIAKDLFIDYGSGKGAALIHARELGFQTVYGVEFAKELNDISIENIKKLNLTNIHSLHQDATTFTPPKETTVIYFFNPFDEVVMSKVVENIIARKEDFLDDVYIIYGRPTCGTLLEKHFTLLKSVEHESGTAVSYYKV
jgi:16S rRNA G966 N2-methylase RsmD